MRDLGLNKEMSIIEHILTHDIVKDQPASLKDRDLLHSSADIKYTINNINKRNINL